MAQFHRRTAPKVRGGKVQKKNRTQRSPGYRNHEQDTPVIDRLNPGPGFRHVLRKGDVERFLTLLPDWEELSRGLDAVLLAPGEARLYGWHRPGRIAVCAWPRAIIEQWSVWFAIEHIDALERLDVSVEKLGGKRVRIHWTEAGVRGFQLMAVLLHELGHHHDRMTTRSRRRVARGEAYADEYAARYADRIWDRYLDEFGF